MMSWSRSAGQRSVRVEEDEKVCKVARYVVKIPLNVKDKDNKEVRHGGGELTHVRRCETNAKTVIGQQLHHYGQVCAVDGRESGNSLAGYNVISCPLLHNQDSNRRRISPQRGSADFYYGCVTNNKENYSVNPCETNLQNNNNTAEDGTTKYVKHFVKNANVTVTDDALTKVGTHASGSKKVIRNKILSEKDRFDQEKSGKRIKTNSVALSEYDNGTIAVPKYATIDQVPHNFAKTIEVKLLTPGNMAISNFHIKFDQNGIFKPGDDVTGRVIMDVWAQTEVCYVEFLLHGKGTVHIFKNSSMFIERPRHEIYLKKQIMLISPPGGAPNMILDPGRYVSDFSYSLSEKLPPSVHQFDMGNGYVFDISYSAQANVCDSVGKRFVQPMEENYAKVIKTVRCHFSMLPLNDWRDLPGANESVHHKEQLLLFCSCTSKPTKVKVSLDRGVYPIGDLIKVRLHVTNPAYRQSVKLIQANLEQRMTYKSDLIQKFRKILISVQDDVRYNPNNEIHTGFNIPIPTTIVPSYIPHCDILDISYNMKITVKFKGLKGKLTVRLPLILTAPTQKIKQSRNIFELTRQHPIITGKTNSDEGIGTYTSSQNSGSTGQGINRNTSSNMETKHRNNIQDQITTKYKTGLKCSPCCLVFCRFGIYQDDEE